MEDFKNFLTCVSILNREEDIFIDQQPCFKTPKAMSDCFEYFAIYVDDRVKFMSEFANNIKTGENVPKYTFTEKMIDRYITKTGSDQQ